jgi:8-oxo-dGTP diphosphatase
MRLYLIRHAKAGSRHDWNGPDDMRPLTKAGRRQAEGLIELLREVPVSRVVSSPFLRCVQTVTPLARGLGLPVEPAPVLAEGAAASAAIDLLLALPEFAVACSHGDVIPDTIGALHRCGMEIVGPPDWRKGATWVLERDGTNWERAYALPPPPDGKD